MLNSQGQEQAAGTWDILFSDISGLDDPWNPSHLKLPGDPRKLKDEVSLSRFSAPPLTKLRSRDTSFWKYMNTDAIISSQDGKPNLVAFLGTILSYFR